VRSFCEAIHVLKPEVPEVPKLPAPETVVEYTPRESLEPQENLGPRHKPSLAIRCDSTRSTVSAQTVSTAKTAPSFVSATTVETEPWKSPTIIEETEDHPRLRRRTRFLDTREEPTRGKPKKRHTMIGLPDEDRGSSSQPVSRRNSLIWDLKVMRRLSSKSVPDLYDAAAQSPSGWDDDEWGAMEAFMGSVANDTSTFEQYADLGGLRQL
jgi:hypothetical protein